MRRSGILLPISSLPSAYGVGTFSKKAFEFVDRLAEAGQSYWQILPLGPTGYGDSPYQSFSTFAGNPYYIDLDALVEEGLLTKGECKACCTVADAEAVDYEHIYFTRFLILRKAYERSQHKKHKEYIKFVEKNNHWLLDYSLYMAIKNSYGGVSWTEWDEPIKRREPEAINEYSEKYQDEIDFYMFQQYLFAKQWEQLKKYANEKGVDIIGDIPIYVAFDSADTWANPELFLFDEKGVPLAVAGCPPDAFSSTGQLWGNPLYRWDYHKKTGYAWWMRRISYCYELYDVMRIDHFRGFDEYYAIPYGHDTAEFGKWEKGPGYSLLQRMKEIVGDKPVIAEDLGYLTDSVLALVDKSGYPGMKVLQFAFDSREESDYLPHNYIRNCVVYTGTHDNDTTLGWYHSFDKKDQKFAKKYLNIQTEENIQWEFIRAAMSSVADTVIVPIQDYLGLGSEARTNTPSTLGQNWKWRMKDRAFTKKLALTIKDLTKLYGRLYSE